MLSYHGVKLFRPMRGLAKHATRLMASYPPKCEGLIVEPRDQVLWLKLDRPKKFNAITADMFTTMVDIFHQANKDDSIKALVLTGSGDFYSSGNDLTNLTRAMTHPDGLRAGLSISRNILAKFVENIINLEKLFIVAVNGPALGISVTILPLADYVIASDKATFQTPFTSLGQCPEACSSVTFPKVLGQSKATELLLLNMKWDAKKAERCGLVSEVIQHDKLHDHLDKILYSDHGIVKSCYPNSMKVSKSLVRNPITKKELLEANQRECDEILDLWMGEECIDAVQKFMSRNKK